MSAVANSSEQNRPKNSVDDVKYSIPKVGGIAEKAIAARKSENDSSQYYLEGLNEMQREAVMAVDGPVLVLAGAGTGKTRVLTTRIAHILTIGAAYPNQILAVTFTNKAAREMKDRVFNLVGEQIEGMPWLGTFHSICAKLLRIHAELVGLHHNFSIIDTTDQIRLLKQLIVAEELEEKRWPARQLASLIDHWKNCGLEPQDITIAQSAMFGNGLGKKLYENYQKRLRVLNATDFGDLMLLSIQLFKSNPDILKKYQYKFRFMLVDEYQDTNVAQYLWLKLLTQANKNICCVGDDDQSIYGWRGAQVENILGFERDFENAKVIRLERNYRSSEHILAVASHLISHNKGRLGKTLFTDENDSEAELVSVASAWDSQSEAREIGGEIETLQSKGHPLNEIAILVRAAFLMREFEECFISLGLNYRVIGGPRFYERKEIRDAIAYFRIIIQPNDDLALERIINVPKRGIGDSTVQQLHLHAKNNQLSLFAAISELVDSNEIRLRARTQLRELINDFARWQKLLDSESPGDLAGIVLDESGYTAMWQNDKSAEAPGRLENLKELVGFMEEFGNMRDFIEHVSLVMEKESKNLEDAVNLMTLHSAKGLEYDTVFLPAWEDGLFPHQRSMDEEGVAGLEEERRLAYVGLTRARKRAKISFCGNRQLFGNWQNPIPSRFLDELPEQHIEIQAENQNYGGYVKSRFEQLNNYESSYNSPGWQRAQRNQKGNDEILQRYNESSRHKGKTIEGELITSSTSQKHSLKLGDNIEHGKFGSGVIVDIRGDRLTVKFDNHGEKNIIADYVRLA